MQQVWIQSQHRHNIAERRGAILRAQGSIPALFFDPAALADLARLHAERYAQARPFPHVVLDDFLPHEVADCLVEEFPLPSMIEWITYDAPDEKKLESKHEQQLGALTRHLLCQFNSSAFLTFLEGLTGLRGLIPDPSFYGGGLHQIERGGYLSIHADFNLHQHLGLYRRVNLLLYLNRGWREEYGGHLELWNAQMTQCEQRIVPSFNRCVIFSTSDRSFHGHPDPLRCPAGQTRKSLAVYYYSSWRSPGEPAEGRSTLWQRRPHDAPTGDEDV